MKVRYRVVPKQNSKPAFYVNCDDKQVTIQAADSAFKTLVSLPVSYTHLDVYKRQHLHHSIEVHRTPLL